jgi:hypothetical protein
VVARRWRTGADGGGPGRGWPVGDTAVGREEGLRRAGKRDSAALACMDLRSRGGLGAGRTCCGIERAVAAAPAPSAEGGSFWRGKEREGVSLCQDVRPAASGAGGKGPTFGCAGGVGGAQAGGEGMAARAAGGASGARAARAAGRGGGWRRKHWQAGARGRAAARGRRGRGARRARERVQLPAGRLLRRPPPFRGWCAGPVGFWQAVWVCWRPRGVWHRPPLPEWALPEMWGSAELADMCIHVPSGAALPGPAHVGPRAMPGTPSRHPRVSAASAAPAALSSSSSGRKVARIPPRRKGSQKCW